MKKCGCYFCKSSNSLYKYFDERFPIYNNCFKTFLTAGLLREESDDLWHFRDDKILEILC